MTRILGIDPGSRITGYGIIDIAGPRESFVDCGSIYTQTDALPDRLKVIFEELILIIAEYKPEEMAVEQVFMHRNANSALKLGQARGAAICAGVTKDLPVAEYTPMQIKQSVVGTGSADKAQMQQMVKLLLKLPEEPAEDAADALGVALCHGHSRQTFGRISGSLGVSEKATPKASKGRVHGYRRGRMR